MDASSKAKLKKLYALIYMHFNTCISFYEDIIIYVTDFLYEGGKFHVFL